MSRRAIGFAAIVACLGAAGSLGAQGLGEIRKGFWAEAGTGGGKIFINCTQCEEPLLTYGRGSYLRFGGSLNRKIKIGLELFALENTDKGSDGVARIEQVAISPIMMWYPWRSGVYFKGGIGVTHFTLDLSGSTEVPDVLTTATGSALTFGIGFDWPLLKFAAITTNLGVYYTANGDLPIRPLGTLDDVITTVYQLNFAITLR